MTHKEEVKFNRLQLKLDAEKTIVEAIARGSVDWFDGTGKGNLVLRAFCEDRLEAIVGWTYRNYAKKYYITISGWKMKMIVSDPELKDILDEGVKKVKEAKEKAKQEADEAKQKKSKIGYMDVFKRVADFIRKNGYTISTPSNENDKVVMHVGKNILHWANVKDFVSAKFDGKHHANFGTEWNSPSIFTTVGLWTHKYYKLAYPSLRKLVDKMKVLGEVSESAIMPFAVMKELNRLKI